VSSLDSEYRAGPSQSQFDALWRSRAILKAFSRFSGSVAVQRSGFAGGAIADFKSGGFSDVSLKCVRENQLFENCGDGTLVYASQISGTNDDRWGTSTVVSDLDNSPNLIGMSA
jgi:hypothetical protein